MAQRSGLKASDEDRDRVAERLRKAPAEGRLLASELEQRLATALRARTYGELDEVVADLPGERVARTRRTPGSRVPHPHPAAAVALVLAIPIIVAAVIAVAVVLITFVMFWAVVAMVSWRFVGYRRGIPAPWVYAHRRRAITRGTGRNAVGSFAPWL